MKDGDKFTLRRFAQDTSVEVRTAKNGGVIVRTENWLILPLTILEMLIIGTLMALNYLFRYDSTMRYESDMVNYSKPLVTCDNSKLYYQFSYPYFSYDTTGGKSKDGLHLTYNLPEWVFFVCGLLTPILTFCLVEGVRAFFPKKRQKEIDVFGFIIPQPLRRIIRIIGVFLLGGCITGIFVCVCKFNFASPRPHFMNVCFANDPEASKYIVCNSTTHSYWSPFEECSNDKREDIVEAMKSFPSYHAALAVYAGVFTSSYILVGAKVRGIYSISLLFILGLLVMTVIGATHRVSTGYSFPRDILWGGLIGLFVAIFTVNILLNSFRERKIRIKREKENSSGRGSEHYNSGSTTHHNLMDKFSSSDSDSSSSSDEYSEVARKIDTSSMIPRAKMGIKKQPIQAVNPVLNNLERRSTFTSESPRIFPQRNLGPIAAPYHSHSLSRGKISRPYNTPRQRNSAPIDVPESFTGGHINYGFDTGPSRKQPRGILAAYEPPPGFETSSHF